MSIVFPPAPPLPSLSVPRDGTPSPLAPPATRGETARAPQPVGATDTATPMWSERPDERPVGPPPAFDKNVLQDIQERLRTVEPEAPDADANEAAPAAGPVTPSLDAPPPAPHALDKKV